jgi:hypothetical protein
VQGRVAFGFPVGGQGEGMGDSVIVDVEGGSRTKQLDAGGADLVDWRTQREYIVYGGVVI